MASITRDLSSQMYLLRPVEFIKFLFLKEFICWATQDLILLEVVPIFWMECIEADILWPDAFPATNPHLFLSEIIFSYGQRSFHRILEMNDTTCMTITQEVENFFDP
ncbi:uncharacterized protein LOC128247020 [Octopus bimaculoides]|uniref:uncharacterized protein LOC128247020 n=1 Tax=Octopus bimaculoides TaxID=37653 RepID=UPI0022E38098|nr:uncharacterized protein LOC128247020 [Octopus bimaculoides]XP_052821533.1 uncharacterized protein LOC128247020 [Octopus bimaculoides]XP_052821534.1 uncharacterized protein LOC128247020 [Octopus bimaculoides]